MLIIPITGKISWRNPPFITLTLILVNCIVYFVFQSDEMQRLQDAENFYMTSGLAVIEVPQYLAYLAEEQPADPSEIDLTEFDEDDIYDLHRQMEQDFEFMQILRNGEIITADHPEYEAWDDLRDQYETALLEVVFLQYGFRPAYHRPVTFLTHIFLHGSVGHLIGNMLFLWILGVALELGCGRPVFTGIYIIGGLFAVSLFWLIYPSSTVPLVGASGAIAGLMGAFTVIYGKNRVNIFFSTGFYFNYLKMPAIGLLPLWVGNELFQLFFGGISQVAYVAHIGGLLGGALLGLINLKVLGYYDADMFTDAPEDQTPVQIEKARTLIADLRFDDARSELEKILAADPHHQVALTQLYNIEKHQPDSQRFHQVAKRLLDMLCSNGGEKETAYRTYIEYTNLAKSPRLSPQLYLKVGMICTAAGDLPRTQKILALLLKKKADLPGIPQALLKLGQQYRQKGQEGKWQKCFEVIQTQYPESVEAQIVRKTLAKQQ